MNGRGVVGRIGGIAGLGGAFVSAIFLTSWPGGPPALAVVAFLLGTAGGLTATAWPRSLAALTVAGLLLTLAFAPLALSWGVAYLPGLVLVSWATLRTQHRTSAMQPALVVADGSPLDDLWRKEPDGQTWRSPAFREHVLVIPDLDEEAPVAGSDELVVIPQTDVVQPLSSRNGLVHVGPPGVIGGLGRRRPA